MALDFKAFFTVNYNGKLNTAPAGFLDYQNRGFLFGDSLFENMRLLGGRIVFWEAHYLRLMASMRILRMAIPMEFTMEFLQQEIVKACGTSRQENTNALIRFTVFRNPGGHYLPETNTVSYVIATSPLATPFYVLEESHNEIELFKDFQVNQGLLANLKTNNRLVNVLGSIFAAENGYQDCLLLNHAKNVTEALNGNIFMVMGQTVTTPPLKEGCLNGVVRKKLLEILAKEEKLEVIEGEISPFELQKADELFVTDTLSGIKAITQYRKKSYKNTVAKQLLDKLNEMAKTDINVI